MSRTNIDADDRLIIQARRLTGLKTKKAVVHKALETLVRTEGRRGILRYYGSGIWKGDLKAMRRSGNGRAHRSSSWSIPRCRLISLRPGRELRAESFAV